MIKANTNLIGKEVFNIGWTLRRGVVIEQVDYGFTVRMADGKTEFFGNTTTVATLEDAIRECESNEMMWRSEVQNLERERDEK